MSTAKSVAPSKKTSALLRTICCCLYTDEATRMFLWKAMVRYTLLVNELLDQVSLSADFEQWQNQGFTSKKAVAGLCKPLKIDKRFEGLPGRFYASAVLIVYYTYESWFTLQKKRSQKLSGKKQWLKMLEDDLALAETTDFDLEAIQVCARAILSELEQREIGQSVLFAELFKMHERTHEPLKRRAIVHLLQNQGKVGTEEEDPEKLAFRLARKGKEIQRLEDQLRSRQPKGRDPIGEKSLVALEEAIGLPSPQDSNYFFNLFVLILTERFHPIHYAQFDLYLLQTIESATSSLDAEFKAWQAGMTERMINLAKIPDSLPYPVLFGSAGDLTWSLELRDFDKGRSSNGNNRPSKRKRKKLKTRSEQRICVHFNGFSKRIFKVGCDRRQLPIFRQFATDHQILSSLKAEDKYSESLLALRSACLFWAKDDQELYKKKRQKRSKQSSAIAVNQSDEQAEQLSLPWVTHRLYLHCSFDPRLLTAEGTEEVRSQKIGRTSEYLSRVKKGEAEVLQELARDDLTSQEREQLEKDLKAKREDVTRRQTSLNRLENNSPPPRPSKVPYEGDPNIVLGVSFCRQKIVGVAVVDLRTQQILEYYTVRELLRDSEVQKPRRNRSILQLQLEKYRLVNRLRWRRQKRPTKRQIEQKKGKYTISTSESNLGQYLERLIAARVVGVALKWRASHITLPQLENIRETIESGVQVKAESLFPGDRKRQKAYAKQFRISFHRWSYNRLAECIRNRSLSEGISVTSKQQSASGNLATKAFSLTLTICNPA
ncbi:MAG: type V CRISPR-associated protein Cas12k [Leptolyngbya sp. BL-A-14]